MTLSEAKEIGTGLDMVFVCGMFTTMYSSCISTSLTFNVALSDGRGSCFQRYFF